MNREEQIKSIYEEIAERINFDWLDWQSLVTRDLAPVMIWDVLDFLKHNSKWIEYKEYDKKRIDILDEWDFLLKPIEEQSDECIEYIYNLIKE